MTGAVPARDPDDLARLEARYAGHRIWREPTVAGASYHARSLSLDTHPYAVVTGSLTELAAALLLAGLVTQAARQGSGGSHDRQQCS